jgi:hypothetical protein
VRLAGRLEPAPRADPVHHQVQRPGRADPRILLPQAAGRRAARVGERPLAGRVERRVQLAEALDREVDLAPDLHELRHVGAGQPLRYLPDRADVGGHLLAGPAVAPGGRPDQPAVLVGEVDREAVDLGLAQVGHRAARVALDPLRPAGQVVQVEHVVQAEHPLGVLDRGEQRRIRPTHPLGRRLRGAQRRIVLLQLLQLAHHRVVLGVGDRRRVEDVVPVLIVVDLRAHRGMPLQRAGGRLRSC